LGDTAVVIGASVAGLAAARTLSDFYNHVVLVDRDRLPDTAVPRRGVPQGPHAHVLAAAGVPAFETLFPGFLDEMVAAGGTAVDISSELRLSRYGRAWPPAAPRDLVFLSASRPLLEHVVRRRVTALSGVSIRDGIAVSGLTGSREAVTGVVLDTGERLRADLVVDCSGRGNRSDRWLQALGLPAPEEIEIKNGLGYATSIRRRTAGDLPGWKGLLHLSAPPAEHVNAMALPLEDDRWIVGLMHWHATTLPTDEDALLATARQLSDPTLAKLLEHTEPVGPPMTARRPSNRRRLFEKLNRPAAGLLTLGDAVCSFNPAYGHGMTVAAQQAVALGPALRRHGTANAALVQDYHADAAAIIATPWQLAVDGDFAHPATTGPRPRGTAFRNWYATRVARASQQNPELKNTFFGVLQLAVPLPQLTRPAVAIQAIRHGGPPKS